MNPFLALLLIGGVIALLHRHAQNQRARRHAEAAVSTYEMLKRRGDFNVAEAIGAEMFLNRMLVEAGAMPRFPERCLQPIRRQNGVHITIDKVLILERPVAETPRPVTVEVMSVTPNALKPKGGAS